MIHVQNLRKTFKVVKRRGNALKSFLRPEFAAVTALDGVSFDIARGEIVGYMGPNGAGKSTSIKIMSGILVPDSGECIIGGRVPWKERREHVARLGVVFGQRSQLWWDTPVLDSFELLRDIYSISADEYARNLSLLCEALSIDQLLQTPVRQLSLGQRMRCEIAASLLHSPDILFLDEPTIGLDAVSKLALRDFIKMINRERGVTVCLTTHDTSDIDALCERVMLIGKGRILYDGGFGELKNNLAPERILTVQAAGADGESISETLGMAGVALVGAESGILTLRVDTSVCAVPSVIARLSGECDMSDIEVKALAVDEIIARLYTKFEI